MSTEASIVIVNQEVKCFNFSIPFLYHSRTRTWQYSCFRLAIMLNAHPNCALIIKPLEPYTRTAFWTSPPDMPDTGKIITIARGEAFHGGRIFDEIVTFYAPETSTRSLGQRGPRCHSPLEVIVFIMAHISQASSAILVPEMKARFRAKILKLCRNIFYLPSTCPAFQRSSVLILHLCSSMQLAPLPVSNSFFHIVEDCGYEILFCSVF